MLHKNFPCLYYRSRNSFPNSTKDYNDQTQMIFGRQSFILLERGKQSFLVQMYINWIRLSPDMMNRSRLSELDMNLFQHLATLICFIRFR